MMAYNIKKVSFHGAFLMVGGTGGIQYDNLPISDRGIADIPVVLQESFLNNLDNSIFNETGVNPMYSDISNYRFDFRNNGLGYSPGIQAGMAYEINDYISVSADFRFTRQIVSSDGFVENIQIYNEHHRGWQNPGNLLRNIAEEENLPFYNSIANIYEEEAADRLIDVKQRGSGITPIFGVNITPTPKLNIGLKYEHRTRTTLTTTVFGGRDGGVFTAGERVRSDIPGFFTIGLGYDITDRLRVHLGSRVFIMNNIDFNGREAYFDGNYFELESALQYRLFDNFYISGGYTFMRPKVKDEFQNDVDFWIPGHTGALGFKWDAFKEVSFNVGALFTQFNSYSTTQAHLYADGNPLASKPENYDPVYDITYKKKAFIIAFGVDFRFPKRNKNNMSESTLNQDDIPYYYRTQ
jgi:long-subunit fatty acid transport protein